MPKTLSLLAVLKKIDTKGIKSLSDPQWNTFLASDTEPNEIKEKIKKLEGYENTGAVYDETGELIVEDNNAMIERFRQRTGRAQGRESLKVKQSKISVKSFKEKFLDKDEKPVKPDTTGASDLVKVDKPPDLSKPDSEEKNEETEGLKGIRDVLDDILKVLRLDFKGDRKEARDAQKQAAKDRRIKKEENIEKKEGAGIGKAVKAMLSPFSNIWKKILKFLKFTLIGVLFNTVWKWFADPENKKKVEAIGRFFKDWWPALAIAATAFLTPLGALVASSVSLMAWAIPALYASILANPWAIPILATLGTAGYLSTQKKKVDKNVDKSVKESSKETALDDLKKEQKERDEQRNPFQKFLFGTVMGEDAERQKQIERVEGMNKGGQVPGSGNKDTVPAMLTPGEFVMSKGAVQQYGVDTMEAMNAAAGGTNIPVLMPDKKRKGFPGGGRPYAPTMGDSEGSAVNKQKGESFNIFNPMTWFGGKKPDPVGERRYDPRHPEGTRQPNPHPPGGTLYNIFEKHRNWDMHGMLRYNQGGIVQGFTGGGLIADTRILGPNTPLPGPGWGKKGGFTPLPMWQKPLPSGGWGKWGTFIKLAKANNKNPVAESGTVIHSSSEFKRGPVGTPIVNSTNKTITLPTIPKQQRDEPSPKIGSDVPDFRIPIVSSQRSMVLASLGINDLVGG